MHGASDGTCNFNHSVLNTCNKKLEDDLKLVQFKAVFSYSL